MVILTVCRFTTENGKFVAINKNKAEEQLATIGIQPSEVSRIISLAKDSIHNSTENVKKKQFEIIEKSNPFDESLGNHTWIKSAEDIKTYREAVEEDNATTPDFTEEDLQNALETGRVTVYSSYPIKDGIFVTPSRMEAQNYAGEGKVYSKTVALEDVAWIDSLQGQYAKVEEETIPDRDENEDIRYSTDIEDPVQIARTPKEQADLSGAELEKKSGENPGTGASHFAETVKKSKFYTDTMKKNLLSDTWITNYTTMTNKGMLGGSRGRFSCLLFIVLCPLCNCNFSA